MTFQKFARQYAVVAKVLKAGIQTFECLSLLACVWCFRHCICAFCNEHITYLGKAVTYDTLYSHNINEMDNKGGHNQSGKGGNMERLPWVPQSCADSNSQLVTENKTTIANVKRRYPINGLLFFLRDMNIRCFIWHRHATHAWHLSTGLAPTSSSWCKGLTYWLIQHLDKPILILRDYLHTR